MFQFLDGSQAKLLVFLSFPWQAHVDEERCSDGTGKERRGKVEQECLGER